MPFASLATKAVASASAASGRSNKLQGVLLVLLCLPLLAAVVAGTSTAVLHGDGNWSNNGAPSLEQVKDWRTTAPDSIEQDSIFCSKVFDPVSTPMENVTKVVQQLCNRKRALDTFLAKRFAGKYSFASEPSEDRQPYSTEPNVPWVLADYVINVADRQPNGDRTKNLTGQAQIDLLLCSDPTCKVLVDLLTMRSKDENATAMRVTAYSGISNILRLGVATINRTMTGLVQKKDAWTPYGMNSTDKHTSSILQVALDVDNATVSGKQADGNLIWFESPILSFADTAKITPDHLKLVRVGRYKASDIFIADVDFDNTPTCISLLWPSHPWMEAHGWSSSDADCASLFEAAQAKGSFERGTYTYVFDSYFPQARTLGNRTSPSAAVISNGGVFPPVPPRSDKYFKEAIALSNGTSKQGIEYQFSPRHVALYVHNNTRLDGPKLL